MTKLKYILACAAVAFLFGLYVYKDYAWPHKVFPEMEQKGWQVAAIRANVSYPERPWSLFKQPTDSIWFIRSSRQIGSTEILTQVFEVKNPHSDEDADSGAYYSLADCKSFRTAVASNVAELQDPNFKPEWQNVGQGPDIQDVQLFIAECKPYYPDKSEEADRSCVNSATLMKPSNIKSCTPTGVGQAPTQ